MEPQLPHPKNGLTVSTSQACCADEVSSVQPLCEPYGPPQSTRLHPCRRQKRRWQHLYRQRQPRLLQDSSESKRAGEPFLATVLGRGPGCLRGGQGATDRCQGGVWFLPETGGRGSWEPGQRVLASPLAQGAGAGAGDRPTMGIKGRKSKAPSLPEGASKGPALEDSTWEAKQYGPRRTGSGSCEERGC